MIPDFPCILCEERATRFFVTLDNCLWTVCGDHAGPFENTTIELDPEKYDLSNCLVESDE